MTLTEFVFRGWKLVVPPDVCWLDCDGQGILEREHLGQHIVLCREHAGDLERGFYRGDYAGALLPPDSRATSWPWWPVNQVA
jgi:hypothetical protein